MIRKHPLTALISGFSLLTVAIAVVVNYFIPFDGIDFNGDSLVYYHMAKYFRECTASFTIPQSDHWPYGYPSLLALAFSAGRESFTHAQWINLIAGGTLTGLTGYLVYRIGKNLAPDRSALMVMIAGTLLFIPGHGTMMKYQMMIMSDMTGALWAGLAIGFAWSWSATRDRYMLIFSGIAWGLAVSTRYVYVLLVVPLALFYFKDFFRIQNIRLPFLFAAGVLTGSLTQLLIFTTGPVNSSHAGLLNDWSLINFFGRSFESADGHQTSPVWNVIYYAAVPFKLEDFTPAGAFLAVAGFIYSLKKLPRRTSLSLFSWYFIFYFLLCGVPIQNTRIAFSLHLPIALYISLGLLYCIQTWKNIPVLACCVLLSVISVFFSTRYIRKMADGKNALKQVAEKVAALDPNEPVIISTSLHAVYMTYPMPVQTVSIFKLSIPEFKNFLGREKKILLAIDEEIFIPQWSNYPAGATYWWIRKNCDCTLVGRKGEYTVYEVSEKKNRQLLIQLIIPFMYSRVSCLRGLSSTSEAGPCSTISPMYMNTT